MVSLRSIEVALIMPINARPFKTQIGEVEVEAFFEGEIFVFRFYGLVEFRPPVTSIEEDDRGKFAVLQETEILHPDGFVLSVETQYDSDLGCAWGYQVSLRRNETQDRKLFEVALKRQGVDPESVILITPPRQLTSVYFNPRGVMDGSAQLESLEGAGRTQDLEAASIRDRVRSSGAQRILFLSHAVRQMSRPDRMITTSEVRHVIANGAVIEAYPNDPRGSSCLVFGRGTGDRPVHVVCSPKPDFLAIITAYLPDRDEWSDDFRVRTKR